VATKKAELLGASSRAAKGVEFRERVAEDNAQQFGPFRYTDHLHPFAVLSGREVYSPDRWSQAEKESL
jgi:hypothetical protein